MKSRRKIAAVAGLLAFVGGLAVVLHAQQVTAATPVTATFSYDSLGRLVKDSYPSNTLNYNYDSAGNRTTSSVQ